MNTAMPDSPIAVISITPNGQRLALRLAEHISCDCYTSDRLMRPGFIAFDGAMAQCVERLFSQYRALVFICATGIAIRTIAPLLVNKLNDPAVLVMDERAKHVISLLSGHVGGANELTINIAALLDADPVITTATDVNQLASLDMIAKALDAAIPDFRESVKQINQMLVSGRRVGLYQEAAEAVDHRGFILVNDLTQRPTLDALVWITTREDTPALDIPLIKLIPRRAIAGIGCRRGTDEKLIYRLLMQQLSANNLHPLALKAIGSVELKKDEVGLINLAKRLDIPFQIYSIEQLAPHEHRFPASAFVRETLGIGSVSQPVAWIMSQGNLCGDTLKQQGITITLGVTSCCMS